jgi:teichuronic acid exporter
LSKLQPLKDKTITGFKWNLAGQVVMYLITLGGTITMSRLLSPSEFGLFGMLTVLSSLASLLVGLGLAHAIVQNQSLQQHDLSSVFWLNLLLGVCVAALFFFCSEPIASFYKQPELAEATRIFSLIFLIYGLSAVPLGLLSKRIEFKHLVFSQLSAAIVSYGIGIAMAYYNWGVKSLVAQALINHLVYVALNFYFARWMPSLTFSRSSVFKIAKFSRNFLPSQLLDFFALNLDMLLVGKYFGKSELGYYGRSSALVQLPVNSLGLIFNKTFFSVFAELQNDQNALSRSYLRAVKMLTLVLMPILILTAIFAEKIILILFGSVWVPMADLVTILSISAALGSYNSFNDSVIVSQGRTDLLLKINVAEKIVLVISVVIGMNYGIMGIAYAKVIATGIMFVPKLLILSRITTISVIDWFLENQKLFGGLIVCGIAGFLLKDLAINLFLTLSVATIGALFANFIFLVIVKEHALYDLLDFLKKIIQKKNS